MELCSRGSRQVNVVLRESSIDKLFGDKPELVTYLHRPRLDFFVLKIKIWGYYFTIYHSSDSLRLTFLCLHSSTIPFTRTLTLLQSPSSGYGVPNSRANATFLAVVSYNSKSKRRMSIAIVR